MKLLSAFVACALLCSQMVYSMSTEMVTCMEQNAVTVDDLVNWRDNSVATDGLKCYMKCAMLSMGTMTEDSKLLLEPMLAKFPPEHHAMVKECCEIAQGGDPCDLAFRHHQCLREKNPEFYKAMMTMKISS